MNQQPFGEKAEYKRPNIIATCFQCVHDRSQKPGLNVDFAANPNNQPQWKQKQTIQLTIDELSALTALFLGKLNDCNFAYHGETKKRSLVVNVRVEKGVSQYAFNLFDTGEKLGYIFLTKTEAFRVYKLCLKQLANYYDQPEGEVINSILHFYS